MDASQGSSSSSDASGNERSSSSSGHLNGSSKACSSQVGAQQAHGLWQLRSVPERGEKGKRKAPDRHYAIQAVCSCNTTEPICAEITQKSLVATPSHGQAGTSGIHLALFGKKRVDCHRQQLW